MPCFPRLHQIVEIGENLGTSQPKFISRPPKQWEANPTSFPGPSHRLQGHLRFENEFLRPGDEVETPSQVLLSYGNLEKGKGPRSEVGGRGVVLHIAESIPTNGVGERWSLHNNINSSLPLPPPQRYWNQFLHIMASCQKPLLIYRPINFNLWHKRMSLTIRMKNLNCSSVNCCCGWNTFRSFNLERPFIRKISIASSSFVT